MILYSSRRRQVFLYTPLDHIPAFVRAYYRGNVAAWRWLRSTGLAGIWLTCTALFVIGASWTLLVALIMEATN